MIKRYSVNWQEVGLDPDMDGDYVKFEDYEKLRQVALALFACVKILAEPDDVECEAILADAREMLKND